MEVVKNHIFDDVSAIHSGDNFHVSIEIA